MTYSGRSGGAPSRRWICEPIPSLASLKHYHVCAHLETSRWRAFERPTIHSRPRGRGPGLVGEPMQKTVFVNDTPIESEARIPLATRLGNGLGPAMSRDEHRLPLRSVPALVAALVLLGSACSSDNGSASGGSGGSGVGGGQGSGGHSSQGGTSGAGAQAGTAAPGGSSGSLGNGGAADHPGTAGEGAGGSAAGNAAAGGYSGAAGAGTGGALAGGSGLGGGAGSSASGGQSGGCGKMRTLQNGDINIPFNN